MAICKLGTTVVGIRGTVGGLIFSANGAGPYARAWGRGPQAQTVRRQLTQSRFGQLAAWWQGLTSVQRDGWVALAVADPEPTFNSLGEPVILSGYDYFVRCNGRRLGRGLGVLGDAPTGAEALRPPSPTVLDFRASAIGVVTFRVDFDAAGVIGDGFFVAFGRVFAGGAVLSVPSGQRLVAFADWFSSPLQDGAAFVGVFGAVPDGYVYVGTAYLESVGGIRSVGTELRTVLGP